MLPDGFRDCLICGLPVSYDDYCDNCRDFATRKAQRSLWRRPWMWLAGSTRRDDFVYRAVEKDLQEQARWMREVWRGEPKESTDA